MRVLLDDLQQRLETFGVNHVSWSNRYFVDHA